MNYWRFKMLYRIAERPYKRRRHKNVSSSVTEKQTLTLAGWAIVVIFCSIPLLAIVEAITRLLDAHPQ